jgi:hypothetical protein
LAKRSKPALRTFRNSLIEKFELCIPTRGLRRFAEP